MNVWIGTAGYSYPDWISPLYPPRTPPRRMLAHYSRHFPLVELNFTFYRCPTPDLLTRLAEQTPAGFQFAVKWPHSLSHEQRSDELSLFRQATSALHVQGRLAGLVVQLPQAVHNTAANRRWLELLGRELAGLRLAVEFRHASWAEPAVPAWLESIGVGLIAVDVPDLPSLYARGLVRAGRRVYIRFHSRVAESWYGEDRERHDYHYPEAVLREWAEALRREAGAADDAVLVFCNCVGTQGIDSARRMAEVLAGLGPELGVVAPFETSPPRQRSLFDW
jgi:uncharacterized protein YecE (DUF72 family)